jgi:hypothetical protein
MTWQRVVFVVGIAVPVTSGTLWMYVAEPAIEPCSVSDPDVAPM